MNKVRLVLSWLKWALFVLVGIPLLFVVLVSLVLIVGAKPAERARAAWLARATEAIDMTPEKARAFLGEPSEVHERPAQYITGGSHPPRFVGRAYTAWFYTVPIWYPAAHGDPCKVFIRDGVVESVKTPEREIYPPRQCCSSAAP